jgi:hypothetical protein
MPRQPRRVARLALAIVALGLGGALTDQTTSGHAISFAHARFPTFYAGFVRSACPGRLVRRVIARTADGSVRYPHVDWSASLSYSIFLLARTPHGLVGWAQMH